jgi:hypothetical protein
MARRKKKPSLIDLMGLGKTGVKKWVAEAQERSARWYAALRLCNWDKDKALAIWREDGLGEKPIDPKAFRWMPKPPKGMG